MSKFDLILGVSMISIGVLFAVFAKRLLSLADFEARRFQYMRAGTAVVAGIAFILVASMSNEPELIRTFGIVVLIGGIAFSLMPWQVWAKLTRWFTKEHLTFYRLITVIALTLLGAHLINAAFP